MLAMWLASMVVLASPLEPEAASAQQLLAPLSVTEVRRLLAGELVIHTEVRQTPQGKAGTSHMWGVINAPPERCWEKVKDYPSYLRNIPRLESFNFLERDADHARVHQVYDYGPKTFELTLNVRFVHALRRLTWALDATRPHDVADSSGSITYVPYGEGTTLMVHQGSLVGGFWTPDFMTEYLTRRDLPTLYQNVKRNAEALPQPPGADAHP